MTHLPNHPTLESVRHMPINEVIKLPADVLALLQADAREAQEAAKRLLDWIDGAIALRYEQSAIAARGDAGKDTGPDRIQDGDVEVTVDLPKRVEWDQEQLAQLAEKIRNGGEDPAEYLEVSFKVPERAYGAWPERIRSAFAPARTVRTGRQTFKLTLKPEAV